jgi:hypothetical protein
MQLSNLGASLKETVTTEQRLLHSQPFTNSRFHFITVESGTPKCCISGPNSRVSDLKFHWNDWNNSCAQRALRGVALSCLRIRPHDGSLVWSLRQYLGGRRLHSHEEVELAVREWVRIKESDCYRDGIFKLVPRLGKCTNVLGDYADIWYRRIKWATSDAVVTSQLVFMTQETLLTDHPS